LNGPIKEEVYVGQSPGFESEEYPNYVYKYHKALYELKKHQEHSMNGLGTFLLKMVLGLVRPTLLSSLEKWINICLYAKSMFMILYLVLLTNHFVMSLEK
jgi:hypothetical protein